MRSRVTAILTQLTAGCAAGQRALLRLTLRSDFLFTPLRAAGMCVDPHIQIVREKKPRRKCRGVGMGTTSEFADS